MELSKIYLTELSKSNKDFFFYLASLNFSNFYFLLCNTLFQVGYILLKQYNNELSHGLKCMLYL